MRTTTATTDDDDDDDDAIDDDDEEEKVVALGGEQRRTCRAPIWSSTALLKGRASTLKQSLMYVSSSLLCASLRRFFTCGVCVCVYVCVCVCGVCVCVFLELA